ncbi:6-bladed beta-propeller [Parabacteroides bouchesdurhonensis]|uniref:6-bladed beta-propeller n=1 Tax=Parabacteroides bouchesdurhonensis TaxID=1936995 RepID=UPI000C85EE20|nr:6-bladed beta-propeller [Parabacteroides bouchesdurhonensis]
MKNLFCLIILFCFSLLLSCTTSQNKNGNDKPQHFVVDIKGNSDPELLKKTMANIEARLVSLDTMDSILFKGSASDLYVVDDFIFVVDKSQKVILRYDRQGKFINKIDRVGQGPEEYAFLRDVFISETYIYVSNEAKIQVYDFDGNYLKTIVPPQNGGDQFYVGSDDKIVQVRTYLSDHQLMIYDMNGQLISEYFPTPKVLLDFYLLQSNFRTIGSYKDGVYVSKYFDTNIYLFKDSITTLATFDFGNMNMPKNFFEGTTEEVCLRYAKIREKSEAVLNFDNLIVTDNWIIFNPPLFTPKVVVYCNRNNGKCLINKDFKGPYATILGSYYAPDGYDQKNGEFYKLVNVFTLKEIIEDLKQSDDRYLEKYPFLNGIDPYKIEEEANDWVLFFKIG